jgi:hypothetical protein
LEKEVGITRPPLTKALKRFVEWGLVKTRYEKKTYYSINRESPIVETILQLDNLLIEKLLGEETLYEIHDYLESKKSPIRTNTVTSFVIGNVCITNSVDLNQIVFNTSYFLYKTEPFFGMKSSPDNKQTTGNFNYLLSKPTNQGVTA